MSKFSRPKIIFITGCTASGKSTIGQKLAERFGGEIISVDSMKVYREMDIGTAKPSRDVIQRVPYHLIDVVEPSEAFSAGKFVEHAQRAIEQITSSGKLIFGVGGTVLYLKSLTEGLFEGPGADENVRKELHEQAERFGMEYLYDRLCKIDSLTANRLHRNDLKRIIRAIEVYELTGKPISSFQNQFGKLRDDYDMLFLGLRHPKEFLNRRINKRVKRMIAKGLVEEVQRLYNRNPPLSPQARDAVGYAEIIKYFEGKWDIETAIEKIKINTRRLAKHQRTWFKRMRYIHWIDVEGETEPETLTGRFVSIIDSWLESGGFAVPHV